MKRESERERGRGEIFINTIKSEFKWSTTTTTNNNRLALYKISVVKFEFVKEKIRHTRFLFYLLFSVFIFVPATHLADEIIIIFCTLDRIKVRTKLCFHATFIFFFLNFLKFRYTGAAFEFARRFFFEVIRESIYTMIYKLFNVQVTIGWMVGGK